MTFTDPGILVGLAALAIPAAIHLLGRRPARRVLLPTMRFAEGAHAASRGRLRLKRVALLAARMALVALLVLALAGPRPSPASARGGEGRPAPPPPAATGPSRGREVAAASGAGETGLARDPTADPRPRLEGRPLPLDPRSRPAAAPIRVLVVDAADEPGARVRSAELVAAAFASPDVVPSKPLARRSAAETDRAALAAAEVIFWVGPRAPPDAAALAARTEAGAGLVWVPADAAPPDAPLANALGLALGRAEAVPAGATLDPAGYASDLLGAFEGGTSGDLGAPVFRRRLVVEGAAGDWTAVRFRDGSAAIADRPAGRGRIVALTAGPAPAWGDLAGRAEFVVLTHSLAEALAPPPPTSAAKPGPADGMAAVAAAPPAGREPRAAQAPPRAADLAGWLAVAVAAAVAAETVLAAVQSPPRSAPEA